MVTFHAPRRIVEHPVWFFSFLNAHGIPLRAIDSTSAAGRMDDIDVSVRFTPKRFRGNLRLDVGCPQVSFSPNPGEEEIRSILASLGRPAKVCDQISSVVAEIGIQVVAAPVEAELDYVLRHCGADDLVAETTRAVRRQQEFIGSFVKAMDFESAARYRDVREQLLDSLYDRCVLSMQEQVHHHWDEDSV
jgi:hypothetical protein